MWIFNDSFKWFRKDYIMNWSYFLYYKLVVIRVKLKLVESVKFFILYYRSFKVDDILEEFGKIVLKIYRGFL